MTELVILLTIMSAVTLTLVLIRARGRKYSGEGEAALQRAIEQEREARDLSSKMRKRGGRNEFTPLIKSALHRGA